MPSILSIIENRYINFIKKGLDEESDLTKFFLKNALLYNRLYFTRNIDRILIDNNFLPTEIINRK